MVFSGRDRDDPKRSFDMSPETERIERLASRVSKLVALHRKQRSEKIAIPCLISRPTVALWEPRRT